MGAILQTENLSIGYKSGKSETLIGSGIGITIEPGTLVSLVGANGIGKSTLLRTLSGIAKPLSGAVYLDGKNIGEYSSVSKARKLSVVLTEPLPAGNLTVYEIVALGRQPYTNWLGRLSEDDKIKIGEALNLTNIGHLSNKKYYELSDGQLQKVLIARALAQETPLIILDEPTTHLDIEHKVSVFRLLRKLAKETGRAVLFSTHDIEMAIEFSDEVTVMTPHSVLQQRAVEIITNNSLNNLFTSADVRFDELTRRFVYK